MKKFGVSTPESLSSQTDINVDVEQGFGTKKTRPCKKIRYVLLL